MTISSVKVAPEAEVMDRSGAVYYTGPPPMVVTGVPFYPGMQPSLPYPSKFKPKNTSCYITRHIYSVNLPSPLLPSRSNVSVSLL
jgi:hypothetical protein